MTFLNPLLLFGLIAAAIPLIIHLFNFRRPRRVDFSSLAFVRELQKSTMQRVRIKQWLLLALRMLAIACLVLAFARPTLKGSFLGTGGASSVAVVVDNSLSMGLRDDQGEYLAQAKNVAAGLINQLEQNDEVFVLSMADAGATEPASFRSRGAALDALAEIELESNTATAQQAIERAAAILSDARSLNKEIYVVTDLQRSTLTDSVRVTLPGDTRLIVLPVGGRKYPNIAVTDVRLASRIVEVGQPVHIEAVLTNYGSEPVEDYVATLSLEGQNVAQTTADLAPGAGTTVTFTATPQQRGWLSGAVQIEEDDFEHDNIRYFTINIPERRRLLLVQGEGQVVDYVNLALSSELTQGRIAFDKETIPESQLASANLGRYDAVLLIGPRDLSSGEVGALQRYVADGGGLLLFPGVNARAADYNSLLAELGGGQVGVFSGARGGQSAPIAAFENVDLEHPLFEGIFDRPQGGRDVRVESPDVYYALGYTAGRGNEQTLVRLSNGAPFLQEIRHGRGVAFLMSVAPDPSWSDFPVRGLFIPLLYRSVFYLSSGEATTGEQFTIGTPGELRVPGLPEGGAVRLVSPLGEEFVPAQRTLLGTALLQVGSSLRTPGVYDLLAGENTVRRIAVNLPARESDLEVLDAREGEQRLAAHVDGDVQVLNSAGERVERIVEAIGEQRYGSELWNVFLTLALLFLVAEMMVAKQWRPEAATA